MHPPPTPMPTQSRRAVSRKPAWPLSALVDLIWASDAGMPPAPGTRERVLPSGAMHIVFRLGESPLRLYKTTGDNDGHAVGRSVLAGVRRQSYIKDISQPEASVGIVLRPGAFEPVGGTPAHALGGRHVGLETVWRPADLREIQETLEAANSLEARLALAERFLLRHWRGQAAIDPLVEYALERFRHGPAVRGVVRDSGYSHRHFSRRFQNAVGVTPKAWCRLQRFNRVLDHIAGYPGDALADIAAAQGFADQAHMVREFAGFAGVTPGAYRRIAPRSPRHVPV